MVDIMENVFNEKISEELFKYAFIHPESLKVIKDQCCVDCSGKIFISNIELIESPDIPKDKIIYFKDKKKKKAEVAKWNNITAFIY